MALYEIQNHKTQKIKWRIYIALDLCLIILLNIYSGWNFMIQIGLTFLILINLIFDIIYLIKENTRIVNIEFNNETLIIITNKKKITDLSFSNIKYSILKKPFSKEKTEIELKLRKGLVNKTIGRIHIRNWPSIFDIEIELIHNNIPRVKWSPQTLWSKYWGIFLDLFVFSVTKGEGDFGMEAFQDKTEKMYRKND